MPTVAPPQYFNTQFFDSNGDPASRYLLFSYQAGTSTKQTTYTDSTGNSANTNPIELDSRGECNLWVDVAKSYKFRLCLPTESDPPVSSIKDWNAIDGADNSFISVKEFGALGDGTTDDATALQAAITASTSTAGGVLVFPPGTYVTTAQLTGNALAGVHLLGFGTVRIKYTGTIDTTKAVLRMTNPASARCTFENIQFWANNRAGYGFLFEGPTGSEGIGFINCYFEDATVDGCLLGDSTGVVDVDCANTNFYRCQFYNNDSRNVHIRAVNAYIINFRECIFGFNAGTSPINHAYLPLAGSMHFSGCDFTALTNADADTCCVLAGISGGGGSAAGLSIRDCYSEEARILKVHSSARSQEQIVLDNIYVNNSDDAMVGLYAVHAGSGKITIRDSYLAGVNTTANNRHRQIYVADELDISNVDIKGTSIGTVGSGTLASSGAGGLLQLDNPHRCKIDGRAPGAVRSLNANWNMSNWTTTALLPNWKIIAGSVAAGYAISRQTDGLTHGYYTCRVRITGTSTGDKVGIQGNIQLPKDIGVCTVFASGKMSVNSVTPRIWVNGTSAADCLWVASAADGDGFYKFFAVAEATTATELGTGSTAATVGVGWLDTAVADMYIDTISVLPGRFSNGMTNAAGLTAPDYNSFWKIPTFAAGDYTGNGSMTWTVASGDVNYFAYKLSDDGNTMDISIDITTSDVGGTPNTGLQRAIPESRTANSTTAAIGVMLYSDNGGATTAGLITVGKGGSVIIFNKIDGSNWTAATGTTRVRGQLTFELNPA